MEKCIRKLNTDIIVPLFISFVSRKVPIHVSKILMHPIHNFLFAGPLDKY